MNVIQQIRSRMRDKENELRVCADRWHGMGAIETAQACKAKADLIDELIRKIVLKVELEESK